MIVEDNADSRELLCELLLEAGFDCDAAATGAEALALIEKVQPDVAILDVGLPEMDGFEVARRIREDPKHAGVRLIALTGYGQLTDRATAIKAGFDEHLVKPVASRSCSPSSRTCASPTNHSERARARPSRFRSGSHRCRRSAATIRMCESGMVARPMSAESAAPIAWMP